MNRQKKQKQKVVEISITADQGRISIYESDPRLYTIDARCEAIREFVGQHRELKEAGS